MFTFFVLTSLPAQDIHFSQFYNTPLSLNPGKTGVFNGNQRIKTGYRNQWSNVVPWETFSASYDRKIIPKLYEDLPSFFSWGILLNYDRSSEISNLTLSNINLTGSYTVIIDTDHLFTFGTLLGYATRGFDNNTLTWDSQWNEITYSFDRGSNSGESFDSDKVSYLETAVGINYRWQRDSRTKLDLGLGVYHFVEPGVGFYDDDDIKLSRRFSLTAEGHFKTCDKIDVQGFAMLQYQGLNNEAVLGGLGKFYLDTRPGRHVEVHLGIGHRFNVAWFPILAVQINNIYVSISYDTDATNINERKGVRPNTLELHFGYNITNPKWKKRCPVY